MRRSLLIVVLSAALASSAIGYKLSLAQNATQQSMQSQKAGSSQAVENRGSSKAKATSATQGMKTEETTPKVANQPNNLSDNLKVNGEKTRPALSSKGLVRVRMKNVDFHVDDAIVLRVRDLRGALLRKNRARPPVFDDKGSFIMRIDSGVIGIRIDTLSTLMNNYVFAYPNAPLKNLSLSTEGNQLKMTGTMHKLTDISFEIVGDLSATPEGKIQLHPTSIKAAGIPVKGLLHLFGVELDELIKASEARGVKIDDNDIIMDPEVILPPPEIRGKVIAVQIAGDEVIQVFDPSSMSPGTDINRLTASRRKGAYYMYYRGGTLRFGKLTMTNADLKIVDRSPKDVFDFPSITITGSWSPATRRTRPTTAWSSSCRTIIRFDRDLQNRIWRE